MPLLSSSLYPRPRPLLLYRRLLSRVSTSPSFSLPALSRPAPAPCSTSSAPTEHSHRPFVYEGTERLSVSSRLVSLDSLSRLPLSSVLCSFFFLFSLSFCLLSFRRLFLLRPLFDSFPSRPPWTCRSPLTVLLPCSCAQRGINYSKNLYCYYYRLTIPSQLSSQRRALESSTMRDSVRALPTTSTRRQRGRRRRRRVVDVWCHSGSPRRETRIDFTRVTFFFSLARAKKEDELRRRGHHVSTRLICMNTDERISRERILDRDVRVLKEHIGVFF